MLYEAIFVVCTLSPIHPWVGDRDTGPTCVEIARVPFPTERQCLTRLGDTLKVLSTEEEYKRLPLPKPFTFFSECRLKVAQGPLVCKDCEDTKLAEKPTTEKDREMDLAQGPIYCTFCKE